MKEDEEFWVYATVTKRIENAEDKDEAAEKAEEEIRKDLGLEKGENIPLQFSFEIQ